MVTKLCCVEQDKIRRQLSGIENAHVAFDNSTKLLLRPAMAEPLVVKLKVKVFALLSIVILTVCLFLYSRSFQNASVPTITQTIVSETNLLTKSKDTHAISLKTSSPNSGYIVTMTYNSQMTRAIRNLMGQQCWARSMIGLSLSITEPFSAESKLVHYRRFWDGLKNKNLHNAVLFGEYFDVDFYNRVSLNESSSQITRWKDFLSDSKTPRKLVTVILPSKRCDFDLKPGDVNLEKQVPPCLYGKNFNELIVGLKERFQIHSVKKVCLDCGKLKHKLSLEELRDTIFGSDPNISEYIVLMNTWRNFAFTRSWLEVPSYCKEAENPKSSKRLISSTSVADHSKQYKDKIIKHEKVVAVMFRIERFLTLKILNRSSETLDSCIEKTLQIHDKLVSERYSGKAGTFITLDIGRFGSKLMKDNKTVSKYGQDSLESINKSVAKMIPTIYNGQFKSMEEYEDTFVKITGGVTERGYISMVQRSIATEADCLIVMGGGSYQQVAISQYLSNHPLKPCIYAVCVADNVRAMLPSD